MKLKIREFEKLFEKKETLEEALDELQPDFDKVDYYSGVLKSNLTENIAEAKRALTELTGIYMTLIVTYSIASTEKDNREVRAYDTYKINYEKDPPIDDKGKQKKFTSKVAEMVASKEVAEYRRVRNIIEGYTKACEKGISSMQSIGKQITEEMKLAK